MRCLNPRRVGFKSDGKTIAWTYKKSDKSYAPFALPCGKCIECRLEYARQWAIRCMHEAKMHDNNSFITLTYSDEHLRSHKLNYKDFQDFAKRLRSAVHLPLDTKEEYERKRISYFVTGEYGDKTKRPHWHAIIFNWRPDDLTHPRDNGRGDISYRSVTLDTLWGKGHSEIGTVTFESAGYCARYAAKKLIHGKDQDHEFHPISKKSSKRAIGKSWLEKYYKDAFGHGQIVLPNGQKCGIPRYYHKWCKEHHWEYYQAYIHRVKAEEELRYSQKAEQEYVETQVEIERVTLQGLPFPIDKRLVKKQIIDEKFNRLQKHLKGDI